MTITANAGPLVVFGQAQDNNPEAGPSLFFSGDGILDPRQAFGYDPGQDFGSATAGWLGSTGITTLNIVPAAGNGAALAAAQATTAGAALTLVGASSSSTGIATNISIVNSNTGVAITGLLAIDAYTSITGYISNGTSGTAGNILAVSAVSGSPVVIGMTLSIPGFGTAVVTGYGPTFGSGSSASSGAGFAGSYTVSGPAIAAGTSGAQLTITASQGTSTGDAVAACRLPFGSAGTIQMWNPQALSARAVAITPVSSTPTASISFTVTGYDIYGVPMTELISLTTASTANTPVNGKKAFKYIVSIRPSVSDTVTYSAGVSNIFGLPIRSDTFGDITVRYGTSSTAPVIITSASGYVPAATNAAFNGTGDVRGTYTNTPSAGNNRFVINQSPPLYNIGSAVGLFGVAQA